MIWDRIWIDAVGRNRIECGAVGLCGVGWSWLSLGLEVRCIQKAQAQEHRSICDVRCVAEGKRGGVLEPVSTCDGTRALLRQQMIRLLSGRSTERTYTP